MGCFCAAPLMSLNIAHQLAVSACWCGPVLSGVSAKGDMCNVRTPCIASSAASLPRACERRRAGAFLRAHGSPDCQIIWLYLSGVCLRLIVCVVYRNSWGTSLLVTTTDSGYQSAWPWVQCGAARRGFPSCGSSEFVGIPRSSFPLAFLKTQFLEWHGHSLFVLHPSMFLDMCFWFRFWLS